MGIISGFYRQCWHSIIRSWSSIIHQWLIPPNPTADPTHILLLLSRVGAEEQLQYDESETPDVAPRAQVGDGNVTLADHRGHRHKLLSEGIEWRPVKVELRKALTLYKTVETMY